MSVRFTLQAPDARRFFGQMERDAARAITGAVKVATDGLKFEMRQQIARAGFGIKLGNAIRSRVYPERGDSVGASGIVYPYGLGRNPRVQRILQAFEEGATIRAAGRKYLAIPTEAAGSGPGGRRLTPQEWERRNGVKLRPIKTRRGRVLLVLDNARLSRLGRARLNVAGRRSRRTEGAAFTRVAGRATVIVFVLVPAVRLGKRLTFDGLAATWAGRIPEYIDQLLPRE